jgi:hypothetical protein
VKPQNDAVGPRPGADLSFFTQQLDRKDMFALRIARLVPQVIEKLTHFGIVIERFPVGKVIDAHSALVTINMDFLFHKGDLMPFSVNGVKNN